MYIVSRQKRVTAATETPILDIVPGRGILSRVQMHSWLDFTQV